MFGGVNYVFGSGTTYGSASGAEVAARYAGGRPAEGQPTASLAPADRDEDSVRRADEVVARAGIAPFLMRDIPNRLARMERYAKAGDIESLREDVDWITRFSNTHDDDLREWSQIRGGGKLAESAANLAQSLRLGTAIDPFRATLDEWSEDGKARRARMLSEKYNVGPDVAMAMFDPSSDLYPVFGPFGKALMAKPRTPQESEALDKAQKAAQEGLTDAAGFVKDYGETFGDSRLCGRFVSVYNRLFNANETVSSPRFMRSAADAFLKQRDGGTAPEDFLSGVKSLRDQVMAQLAPNTKNELETRAREHEANSYVSAFLDATKGQIAPDSLAYGPALASAAAKVASAQLDYGIDLREAGSGVSKRVAGMALTMLGVPGADDGNLTEWLDGIRQRVDLVKGSDGPTVVDPADKSRTAQPAEGSYAGIEKAMCKTLGNTIWRLSQETGMPPSGNVSEAIGVIMEDKERRARLTGALADTIQRQGVASSEVAMEVARGLVGNVAGETRHTFKELLLEGSGLVDKKTGDPIMPPGVALSSGDTMTDSDLRILKANPEVAIPTAKFQKTLRGTVRDYAQDPSAFNAVRVAFSTTERKGQTIGLYVESVLGNVLAKDKKHNSLGILEKLFSSDSPDALIALAIAYKEGSSRRPLNADLQDYRMSMGGPPSAHAAIADRVTDKMDSRFREIGVAKDGDPVAQVIQYLQAKGTLKDSVLYKSGLVTPEGRFSPKTMFQKLQHDGYMDPAADHPATATSLQEEYRKALQVFSPLDSAVGSALTQMRDILLGEGWTKEEVADAEGQYRQRFAAEWRNNGAAGLEKMLATEKSYRTRFLPVMQKDGSFSQYEILRSTKRMTDKQWDDHLQAEKQNYETRNPGKKYDIDYARRLGNDMGPTIYRNMMKRIDDARRVRELTAAKEEAKDRSM